ncbi:hypothetical protein ACU8KH_01001 [Lachancea thermotolerans]
MFYGGEPLGLSVSVPIPVTVHEVACIRGLFSVLMLSSRAIARWPDKHTLDYGRGNSGCPVPNSVVTIVETRNPYSKAYDSYSLYYYRKFILCLLRLLKAGEESDGWEMPRISLKVRRLRGIVSIKHLIPTCWLFLPRDF